MKFIETAYKRALTSLSWSFRYDPIMQRLRWEKSSNLISSPQALSKQNVFGAAPNAEGNCNIPQQKAELIKRGIDGEERWQCTNPIFIRFPYILHELLSQSSCSAILTRRKMWWQTSEGIGCKALFLGWSEEVILVERQAEDVFQMPLIHAN